jgi:hypothetical protein
MGKYNYDNEKIRNQFLFLLKFLDLFASVIKRALSEIFVNEAKRVVRRCYIDSPNKCS